MTAQTDARRRDRAPSIRHAFNRYWITDETGKGIGSEDGYATEEEAREAVGGQGGAPALLAALKEIAIQYENTDLSHLEFRVCAKAVADAAIAAAEGRGS
jgi:hypothetical protein